MKKLSYKKAFTLVEMIVGVTILTAAIAGPMTLAAASIRASRDARLELIATHLAEEGVEVIHNMRDNNVTNYATSSWLTNILPQCGGAGCVADVTVQDPLLVWAPSAIISCVPDCTTVSPMYYNPNTGLYRQSALALTAPWIITPYKRSIVVTGVDNATPLRQARIVVTVTYVGYGNNTRKVVINDDLYNWFPPLK